MVISFQNTEKPGGNKRRVISICCVWDENPITFSCHSLPFGSEWKNALERFISS